MLSKEDKKDVKGAFGKALANKVSRVTKDGMDKNKRWGNSAIKGVGANSPAMMEARKGFAKSKALQGKSEKNRVAKSFVEVNSADDVRKLHKGRKDY